MTPAARTPTATTKVQASDEGAGAEAGTEAGAEVAMRIAREVEEVGKLRKSKEKLERARPKKTRPSTGIAAAAGIAISQDGANASNAIRPARAAEVPAEDGIGLKMQVAEKEQVA